MKVVINSSYIPSLNFLDFILCEHCLYGKQTMLSHSHGHSQRSESLDLMHSNVCGHMLTISLGGAQYFVLFIVDYSRKIWAYTL